MAAACESLDRCTSDGTCTCAQLSVGNLQARSIAAHHGVPSISPNLHAYISRALEAHMGDLLRRAYVIARQRADVGRRMPGMEVGRSKLAQ